MHGIWKFGRFQLIFFNQFSQVQLDSWIFEHSLTVFNFFVFLHSTPKKIQYLNPSRLPNKFQLLRKSFYNYVTLKRKWSIFLYSKDICCYSIKDVVIYHNCKPLRKMVKIQCFTGIEYLHHFQLINSTKHFQFLSTQHTILYHSMYIQKY